MTRKSDEQVSFDKPSYLCEEDAWVRALDYAVHAETPETFVKRLADWLPFFPDVALICATLTNNKYVEYGELRRGLQAEREGRFAGEEWAQKFGALLIPARALKASLMKEQYQVPWGACVIRLAEMDSPTEEANT